MELVETYIRSGNIFYLMKDFIEKNKERIIEELKEFLRLRSIGTDPKYNAETRETAEWLRDHLSKIGMKNARLIDVQVGGKPIVYAEWLEAGEEKPTLLIYGHYDVQPAETPELWDSPPFNPEVRDGYVYGRGATDNKGQFFAHLKAFEYFLQTEGKLSINAKVFIEGEEESAGTSLEKWLVSNKDSLGCEIALISDSHMPAEGEPSIEYGLRGIAYFEVVAYGAKTDLHSGMFGGGVANPANVLVQLIAGMQDKDSGRVLIPGFYDGVEELSDEERAVIKSTEPETETLKKQAGVEEFWGDEEYSLQERLTVRPTMDVHGVISGFVGEGVMTVLPSKARVKVSFRLVPGQDPLHVRDIFRDYVQNFKIKGVRFEVVEHGLSPAVYADRNSEYIRKAASVLERLWGKKPGFHRTGGSIPIIATISGKLGIVPLIIGYGLPDDNLHAPNERMKLSMFFRGVETTAELMRELAD